MSWQVKKLGEVCRIEIGKTPSRSNKALWDESKQTKNLWVSIADLPKGTKSTVYDTKEYISHQGALGCKLVPKDTLLVSFKLTLGRLAIAGMDLYTNEAIASLFIHDENNLLRDYLYWYLEFFNWNQAVGSDIKVKGKTLNKEKLKALDVLFPNYEEQQRIVAILDAAFEQIDQAKAIAQQNLQNAREIFDSALKQAFTETQITWNYLPFKKTLKKVKNTNKIPRKLFLSSGSYPIISQEKDFINGYWNNSDDLFKVEKPVVIFGDHTKVIKLVGFDFVMGADGVKVLLPNDKFDSAYFYYFLRSVKLLDLGYARHFKLLADLIVPQPTIENQRRIAEKLGALADNIKELESIYQQKITALDELKQSLLQQAFSGQLTAKHSDATV